MESITIKYILDDTKADALTMLIAVTAICTFFTLFINPLLFAGAISLLVIEFLFYYMIDGEAELFYQGKDLHIKRMEKGRETTIHKVLSNEERITPPFHHYSFEPIQR